MRRWALSILLVVGLMPAAMPPAVAANRVFDFTSTTDTFNPPDIKSQYDIQKVNVALMDDDLDSMHFWILFAQPLTANMFNDGQDSWAGILIDTNNDGVDDIVLNTLNETYTSNISQQASGTYRNGSKSCTTLSWMDLDNKSPWLGFKVSQKCLGLGNKFRVQAYSDYIATTGTAAGNFDYAPNAYEVVDFGDYYNPKPKISLAVPTSSPEFGKSLVNYSSAPENLANLSASLRDSVVTIECVMTDGIGTGTAWSAKVQLPANIYKSFLITNYHVISDCISKGLVDVILNNKVKIQGVLAAWDPDNDLAGIYVQTLVPPLIWQGSAPLQGGWVGVLGSPKGLPGILTTGIVSSVELIDKYITFTAPINPGNSGGPVFDSVGRVMAIATAKIRDSEGFGIGRGVPLLCAVVIKCNTGQMGWAGAFVAQKSTSGISTANAAGDAAAAAADAAAAALDMAQDAATEATDAANAATDAADAAAESADATTADAQDAVDAVVALSGEVNELVEALKAQIAAAKAAITALTDLLIKSKSKLKT